MDLTALLLRTAARRPHVLVVAVPGATDVRLAVEAALARRGWPVATGPADTDVLAVAGAPGPELAAVIDAVWEQVPAPRARIEVRTAAHVDDELAAAAALLADADHQRSAPAPVHENHDGHGGPGQHGGDAEHGHHEHAGHEDPTGHGEHAGHEEHAGHGGHAGHGEHEEHGGHGEHGGDSGGHGEHGGDSGGHGGHADHGDAAGGGHAGHGGGHHGHHDHGGMVAGLPMAEVGPDRDGLTLDRLHVPLGPVLPDWPAGLVVRVTLQGDVIQEASAEVLDAGHTVPFEWPSAAARELDGLARFLGVAGWPSAAGEARRLRDVFLAGEREPAGVASLLRRIRRSRTLRWLIKGIPAGPTNVAALLATRMTALEAALHGAPSPEPQQGGFPPVQPQESHLAAARVGDLLVGAELAVARLIVAAVGPETDRSEAGTGAGHG